MGLSFQEHIVTQNDNIDVFLFPPNSSVAKFSSLGGGELICEVEIKFVARVKYNRGPWKGPRMET